MYNPFHLLNAGLLQERVVAGKRYFVRQTFPRGLVTGIRAAFLIRAYEASEKELSEQHLKILAGDPQAFLYDAANPEHLRKLYVAASQPAGFSIFYAGKKGLDWKPPAVYEEKIKHYIRKHHADWRPKKGGDRIRVGLYEEFGALFLTFSFDDEEETIPFDQIEKY